MLSHLSIKNIAIIDQANVEFTDGFNVLTGETAAGKSILIDSINMVLGERTSRDLIRHGESKAVVEVLFQIENNKTLSELQEQGIEMEDNTLILRREITADGRNVCRANGQLITTSMLKDISKNLVNIHGQHDSQQLLIPSKHIEFLDRYANIQKEKEEYASAFLENKKIKEELEYINTDQSEKQRRIDMLSFQIEEIEKAKLKPNEEEELKEQQNYLSNLEKINGAIHNSYEILYNSESSVHDALALVRRELEGVSIYNPKLEEFYHIIEEVGINLDDLVYQLRDYADEDDYQGGRLDQVEARLDLIHGLKRKYGNNIDEILSFLEQANEELSQITHSDEIKKELELKLKISDEKIKECAFILTKNRKEAAAKLEQKIMTELSDLEMTKVKFAAQIMHCEYNNDGADKIEFLIATNAGEPLKPLVRIASGGELSRIMLAIQAILSDTDMVDTLIFDEIDTGISGRTAYKTAEKIKAISERKQIICITHLAQIACVAKTHFVIKKETKDEMTRTNVLSLDREGRKTELARIIGGAQITELTLQNAEEMLRLAEGT